MHSGAYVFVSNNDTPGKSYEYVHGLGAIEGMVAFSGDLRAAEAPCRVATVPAGRAGGDFTLVIAGGNGRI